jgi:hypothetical protein
MSPSKAINDRLKSHQWENQAISKKIQQIGYLIHCFALQFVRNMADLLTS